MATYLTNKERTNYARFCRVIVDLCTDVLRDDLNRQVHPGSVNSLVTKCLHLKFSGLRPNQRKLINDAAGVGSYKEFDITLLCLILRLLSVQDIRNTLEAQIQPKDLYTYVQNCPAFITNPGAKLSPKEISVLKEAMSSNSSNNCEDKLLCKLCKHLCPGPYSTNHPSSLFWGEFNMPGSTRTTLGDDIERVRLIRNSTYGHASTTEIPDKEFSENWSILEKIMVRMDQRHPGKQYKQKLDTIKTMCMDEATEKRYRVELQRLCKEEEEIQKEIAKIKQDMAGMRTDIVDIKEENVNLKSEVKGSMGESENRLRTEMQTQASDLESKINQTENKLGEMKFEGEKEKQNTLKAILDLKVSADDKEATAMQRIKMVEETVESRIAKTEEKFEKKVEEAKDNLKDVVKEVVTDQEILQLNKQTLKRIEDHKNDKTFVATKAVDKGEDILAKTGMLMYSGLPGSGKTKNALGVIQRYHDLHPDWLFLELSNVRDWRRYVDPDIDTLMLLDDVIGSTNANDSLVNAGKEYWEQIAACVKTGKLRVIMTNRKNILLKSMTKLEQYEIFNESHTIDLTSSENKLSVEEKKKILSLHLSNNGIVICDALVPFEENYTTVDLLDNSSPIKLNNYTIRKIIETEPVLGFPFSCHLFACNRKYTKLGPQFFRKPTQSLIDEINKLMGSESKYIEKIQYCIMSYMLLNHGTINLKGADTSSEMFNKVISSLQLPKKPSNRDTIEAAEKLNYVYIEKVNESEYVFKHQTILESVAICFYDDNPHLLLDLCNPEFIKEFIRPPTYRKSDGEVNLTITPEEYRNVAQRFISNCTSGNRGCKWWVEHQLMDDDQFVDCFMDLLQDNETNKQSVERLLAGYWTIFRLACDSGKTYLIDRLYKMFQHVDTCTWICSVHIPCMRGYTDTVIWLLDHKLGMEGLLMALLDAPTITLTAMIQHPNTILEIVYMALDGLSRNCDCTTVAALLNRWPSLDKKLVLRLLFDISYFGDYRAIDAIIEYRPDVITRESIQIAFLWACIGNGIETIEYLLKIQHPAIDTKTIHVLSNKEGLTILHIAAFYGRFDVLKKLIDLGLSVSDRTESGLNVLQMAILGYSCQGLGKTVQHFKAAWKYSNVMYGSDVADVVRNTSPTLANLCMKIQDRLNIFDSMGMNGVPDSLFYRQIIEYITTLTEVDND